MRVVSFFGEIWRNSKVQQALEEEEEMPPGGRTGGVQEVHCAHGGCSSRVGAVDDRGLGIGKKKCRSSEAHVRMKVQFVRSITAG